MARNANTIYIYTNASDPTASLVTSQTNLNAGTFPVLTLGDTPSFTVLFTDGTNTYPTWAGGAGYSMAVAIGPVSAYAQPALSVNASFSGTTGGWTGLVNLNTTDLVNNMQFAGIPQANPYKRYYFHVAVTDSSNNVISYALIPFQLTWRVVMPNSTTSPSLNTNWVQAATDGTLISPTAFFSKNNVTINGEPALGNPSVDGYVLTSTTAGVRSWAAPGAVSWGGIGGTLANQTDLQTALGGKEPTISSGTTSQYWRGDKTWRTLSSDAVTSLTGTAGQITASASTGAVTLSLPSALTSINSVTASASTDLTLSAGSGNQNVVLAPTGTGVTSFGGSQAKGGLFASGTSGNSSSGKWVEIIYNGTYGVVRAYDRTGATGTPLALNDTGGSILLGTATDSSNGRLQLASHTTSAGGIGFGTDATIYRSAAGTITFGASTASTSTTTGSATFGGGIGVAGNIWSGGALYSQQTGGAAAAIEGARLTNLTTTGSVYLNFNETNTTATPAYIIRYGSTHASKPNWLELFSSNTLNFIVNARTSGSAAYFTITPPTDTTLTASVAAPGYVHATATRQWTNGTVADQNECVFNGVTLAGSAATATFTDASTVRITPSIVGTNAAITRNHSLTIVDSTSAASSITGGFVIATTLGTTATSVGIGGGNINAGGTLTVGGNTTLTGTLTVNGASTTTKHIIGNSTAPTVAAGAAAGTSPTVTVSTAHDTGFLLNVTTGTAPTTGVLATVTFNVAYGAAPICVFSAGNANAAAISGTTGVYGTSTTTTFVLNSGTAALAASTAYVWHVQVIQ